MVTTQTAFRSHQVSREETAELPQVSDLAMVEMLWWQAQKR